MNTRDNSFGRKGHLNEGKKVHKGKENCIKYTTSTGCTGTGPSSGSWDILANPGWTCPWLKAGQFTGSTAYPSQPHWSPSHLRHWAPGVAPYSSIHSTMPLSSWGPKGGSVLPVACFRCSPKVPDWTWLNLLICTTCSFKVIKVLKKGPKPLHSLGEMKIMVPIMAGSKNIPAWP